MKIIIAILILVCLQASAQTNRPAHRTTKRSAPIEELSPEEKAFTERCAANFQWRAATNELAKAKLAEAQAKKDWVDTRNRANLAAKAKQIKSANTPEVKSAKARVEQMETATAAAELKKLNLETEIRKYMPKTPAAR